MAGSTSRWAYCARDFLPEDLKPLLDRAGIGGTVLVQARQTLEETEWMLQQAEETSWIRGVVGWAPIAAAEFPEMLKSFRQNKKLKGIRHLIQDEPDDEFILDPAFNRGIRAMRDSGLVYDVMVLVRHLASTLQFVDMHPDQPFVLDHCAKPVIRKDEREPWATVYARAGAAAESCLQNLRPGDGGRLAAMDARCTGAVLAGGAGGIWSGPAALRFGLAGRVAGDGAISGGWIRLQRGRRRSRPANATRSGAGMLFGSTRFNKRSNSEGRFAPAGLLEHPH